MPLNSRQRLAIHEWSRLWLDRYPSGHVLGASTIKRCDGTALLAPRERILSEPFAPALSDPFGGHCPNDARFCEYVWWSASEGLSFFYLCPLHWVQPGPYGLSPRDRARVPRDNQQGGKIPC